MRIASFHFQNGWFAGYYIIDEFGVEWPIEKTKKEAYKTFRRLKQA